jgi:hypothetical protein
MVTGCDYSMTYMEDYSKGYEDELNYTISKYGPVVGLCDM